MDKFSCNKKKAITIFILLTFLISGCGYLSDAGIEIETTEKRDTKRYIYHMEKFPSHNDKLSEHIEEESTPSIRHLIIPAAIIIPEDKMPSRSLERQDLIPLPTLVPTLLPEPKVSPAPTISSVITKAPTPTIAPKSEPEGVCDLNLLMGKDENYIISIFGKPKSYEKSEYGFIWHVYHKNFDDFFMIGIENEKVVGIYSNSEKLYFDKISIGTKRDSLRSSLGKSYDGPLTYIQKGNTRYNLSRTDERDVYLGSKGYVTFFYDLHNSKNPDSLTAIQIIETKTELQFGYFPSPCSELTASYERIAYYLINSIRARMGYKILAYDGEISIVARTHSQDMVDCDYFSHNSLPEDPDDPEDSGKSFSERIKDAGFSYLSCAENISMNHSSAIYAHESLMNSKGHRDNILRKNENVGIGVVIGSGTIRMTQIFITYR